jgi:hypothetical protein
MVSRWAGATMKYVLVDPSSRLNWSFQWDDPADPLARGRRYDRLAPVLDHAAGHGAGRADVDRRATDTVVVSGMLAGCCYRLTMWSRRLASRTIGGVQLLRCDHT